MRRQGREGARTDIDCRQRASTSLALGPLREVDPRDWWTDVETSTGKRSQRLPHCDPGDDRPAERLDSQRFKPRRLTCSAVRNSLRECQDGADEPDLSGPSGQFRSSSASPRLQYASALPARQRLRDAGADDRPMGSFRRLRATCASVTCTVPGWGRCCRPAGPVRRRSPGRTSAGRASAA